MSKETQPVVDMHSVWLSAANRVAKSVTSSQAGSPERKRFMSELITLLVALSRSYLERGDIETASALVARIRGFRRHGHQLRAVDQ